MRKQTQSHFSRHMRSCARDRSHVDYNRNTEWRDKSFCDKGTHKKINQNPI